jgi:hypothetical protein
MQTLKLSDKAALDLSFMVVSKRMTFTHVHDWYHYLKEQTQERPAPAWWAEYLLLTKTIQARWKSLSEKEMETLKKAFDFDKQKVKESMVSLALEMAQENEENIRRVVSPVAYRIAATIQQKARSYFSKRTKAEHDDKVNHALRNWVADRSADQIATFTAKYPTRIIHPEIQRLIEIMQESPEQSQALMDHVQQRLERVTKRYDGDYWDKLGTAEASFLWNSEGILYGAERGVTTYTLANPMDVHTCPVCKRLHGHIFYIDEAKQLILKRLTMDDPEEIKKAFPFPTLYDVDNMSPQDIESVPRIPPFHNGCRDLVEYLGAIQPPVEEKEKEAELTTATTMKELGVWAAKYVAPVAVLGVAAYLGIGKYKELLKEAEKLKQAEAVVFKEVQIGEGIAQTAIKEIERQPVLQVGKDAFGDITTGLRSELSLVNSQIVKATGDELKGLLQKQKDILSDLKSRDAGNYASYAYKAESVVQSKMEASLLKAAGKDLYAKNEAEIAREFGLTSQMGEEVVASKLSEIAKKITPTASGASSMEEAVSESFVLYAKGIEKPLDNAIIDIFDRHTSFVKKPPRIRKPPELPEYIDFGGKMTQLRNNPNAFDLKLLPEPKEGKVWKFITPQRGQGYWKQVNIDYVEKWEESQHPRDSHGKFTDKPGNEVDSSHIKTLYGLAGITTVAGIITLAMLMRRYPIVRSMAQTQKLLPSGKPQLLLEAGKPVPKVLKEIPKIFEHVKTQKLFSEELNKFRAMTKPQILKHWRNNMKENEFCQFSTEWIRNCTNNSSCLLKKAIKHHEGSEAVIRLPKRLFGVDFRSVNGKAVEITSTGWERVEELTGKKILDIKANYKDYASFRAITQAYVEKQYPKGMTVYRGIGEEPGMIFKKEVISARNSGKTHIHISEDVVASYSKDYEISKDFAKYGIIIKKQVRPEDIIMPPEFLRLKGRSNEFEFVVKQQTATMAIPVQDVFLYDQGGKWKMENRNNLIAGDEEGNTVFNLDYNTNNADWMHISNNKSKNELLIIMED